MAGSLRRRLHFDWDQGAPDVVKAKLAFSIIWAIAIAVQLFYILKRLPTITSPWSARFPYILLAFVTFCLVVLYILSATADRLLFKAPAMVTNKLSLAVSFFHYVDYAFRPALVLWLATQRGVLLQAAKAYTVRPLACRNWKRILDWVLVGCVFVFSMASLGVNIQFINGTGRNSRYLETSQGLLRTMLAFFTLLCIDVIVTLITLFVHGQRAQHRDPIIRCLFMATVPFFAVYAIEVVGFHVYYATTDIAIHNRIYSATLAKTIIDGVCRIVITGALIVTITLPGVQWIPQPQTAPPAIYPITLEKQAYPQGTGVDQSLYGGHQAYYQQQQQQPPYHQSGGQPHAPHNHVAQV